VAVQGGPRKSGLGDYFAYGYTFVPQHQGMFELVRIHDRRPACAPAVGSGNGPGMGRALGRVGALHFRKEGQDDHCQLRHRTVRSRRVDTQRVGQRSNSNSAFVELVHQVERIPHRAPQPVQGVHHDDIARPGVLQRTVKAGAISSGSRPLIGKTVVMPTAAKASSCRLRSCLVVETLAYPISIPARYRKLFS